MEAVEFKTVVDNPYIKIPDFEKFKGKRVRVVLFDLNSDTNFQKAKKIDFFDKVTQNPKHIKNINFFSREEAHER